MSEGEEGLKAIFIYLLSLWGSLDSEGLKKGSPPFIAALPSVNMDGCYNELTVQMTKWGKKTKIINKFSFFCIKICLQ